MRRFAARPVGWLAAAIAAVGLAVAGCADEVPEEPDPTGPSAPPAPTSPADATARVEQSVVSVEVGQSSGSGIVLTADGHILTTEAIAGPAGESVTVTVAGGGEHPATVAATDSRTGLAVITVDGAADLVPAAFGDSDAVAAGDEVLVVGGPLVPGEPASGSVVVATGAFGVLSAIETDVVVVLGSGGGPLVDAARGEVIGILVGSRVAAGEDGAGIALPANLAARVADQLAAGEQVTHPYLGVSLGDADGGGALVEEVGPQTPAEAAGLRPGDVITELGGRPVDGSGDVLAVVQGSAVGDELAVVYTRDGAEQDTTVTLGQAPAD